MKKYLSDRGKIVAKRISGTCNKHQRRIAKEIKRARFIALVPFTVEIYR
jgi:small subunit ribosomal protein S18